MIDLVSNSIPTQNSTSYSILKTHNVRLTITITTATAATSVVAVVSFSKTKKELSV